jgi:WD40 repeat protein
MFDVPGVDPEFILLNQDGSGRTAISVPACGDVNAFLLLRPNAGNYMINYRASNYGGTYLFRPAQAEGLHAYGGFPPCNTSLSSDEKGTLLAVMDYPQKGATPELVIYELPGGKIRSRFPLVRCAAQAKACEEYRNLWYKMGEQTPAWSPNGRYLAFAAIMDAASSDLFVYDSRDDSLRQLTSGPDWVGPIDWSPDGTRIIMQEILGDGEHFFSPAWTDAYVSSVWSVSVSTDEIKRLYTVDNAPQTIRWLDNKRFYAFDGRLLNADVAHNLRVANTETGESRIIFDGDFMGLELDPVHETFLVSQIETPKYHQGYYLVSTRNSTIQRIEGPPSIYSLDWDEKSGLFVDDTQDCENDPQSFLAVDHLGNFKCVPKPVPTTAFPQAARYPAPDGKWTISVQNGIWLEATGKAALQISEETASEVIWCPDASCFFFFAPQQDKQWSLYRVSVPDLAIKLVDEGIKTMSSLRWLGDDK